MVHYDRVLELSCSIENGTRSDMTQVATLEEDKLGSLDLTLSPPSTWCTARATALTRAWVTVRWLTGR